MRILSSALAVVAVSVLSTSAQTTSTLPLANLNYAQITVADVLPRGLGSVLEVLTRDPARPLYPAPVVQQVAPDKIRAAVQILVGSPAAWVKQPPQPIGAWRVPKTHPDAQLLIVAPDGMNTGCIAALYLAKAPGRVEIYQTSSEIWRRALSLAERNKLLANLGMVWVDEVEGLEPVGATVQQRAERRKRRAASRGPGHENDWMMR